jgi:hypothetical protein
VVVELLSPGTEAEDLGPFFTDAIATSDQSSPSPAANGLAEGERSPQTKLPSKFEVYERYLRIPHYIVYSRYTRQLRYFRLYGGIYQEQPVNPQPPLIWLTDLKIGLGLWEGTFEDISSYWLRWCNQDGNWLLTDTEQAQAQLLQAAQNLLATGMPIAQVAAILELSAAQIQALQIQPPISEKIDK